MKTNYEDAMHRIQTKLKKQFPIGCRVKLTAAASKKFPKQTKAIGTVTYHSRNGTCLNILWDGRKTVTTYHRIFIRRVRPSVKQ